MPRWLKLRDGLYSYCRRVPAIFADVDSRRFALVSLGTRDLRRAEKLRDQVNREQEALWLALKRGGSDDVRERYIGAIDRARLEGFEYRPAGDLAAGEVAEILKRLERLEALGALNGEAASPAQKAAQQAVAGGAVRPELTLSKAFAEYEGLVREELRKKSPDQLRRWRAPRLKAVNNLIALVGDKAASSVSRADGVAFRAWWVERVVEEELTPNSANKDIGHLQKILDTLNEKLELGMGRPFARLRLRDDEKRSRLPFSAEQLLLILEPRHLAGLNEEARDILLLMVETGMRPIEICNLRKSEIVLESNVPHVLVRPGDDRELKTPYSKRDIPLVGISLEAARRHPEGFPRYRDRSASLSALVNKVLRGRGLLPTDDHSLYSIRHSFQDRLVAAEMPDRMQADLMGHKFQRPRYGEGATLEHKQEWLLKLAVTEHRPPDPAQAALF
jgi:integrase